MSATIYVEGGGRNKSIDQSCRQAFRALLTKAGFQKRERLPRVVPCGPRNEAIKRFANALIAGEPYPVLLVDSEDLVASANQPHNPAGAWRHLQSRDSWARPPGTADDQAQLMVTTMETWLLADRATFVAHFHGMNPNALPPDNDLENRSKDDIASDIEAATRTSSKGVYNKGRDSFDLLGKVNPNQLKAKLPHFKRFIDALAAHA